MSTLTVARNRAGQILYLRPLPAGTRLGQVKGTGVPPERFYKYDKVILDAAAYYGIDPLFVKAILLVESGFRPEAESRAKAQGIAQFMAPTAESVGVTNRRDPIESIWGCAALLRRLCDQFNGNMILMAAGYNAGANAVEKAGRRVPRFSETQQYVPAVLWAWDRMQQNHYLA
jgi:soluble lytic murein transglycosylase-like protein